jgi:hypothetical protein
MLLLLQGYGRVHRKLKALGGRGGSGVTSRMNARRLAVRMLEVTEPA